VFGFRANDAAKPMYKMANRMAESGLGLTTGARDQSRTQVEADDQAKLG